MKNIERQNKTSFALSNLAALILGAVILVSASVVSAEDEKVEEAAAPVLQEAEDRAEDSTETDPCLSTNPELGDSAFWAVTAIRHFSEKRYKEAVKIVDSCFERWGPEAGQQQKAMHDSGKSCPAVGKVDVKSKAKIDKNYLMNDVSTALWSKARSLHKLGLIEEAKNTYAQCMYMVCGRTWDPKGWFWSPAKDCATEVQKIM